MLGKEEVLSLTGQMREEPTRERAEKLNKEFGRWLRRNKKIHDDRLLGKLMAFLRKYNRSALFNMFKIRIIQLIKGKIRGKLASKTLARFTQKRYVDCLILSTAMGEMARTIGFEVQYYEVEKDKADLTKLPEDVKKKNRSAGRGPCIRCYKKF